MNIRLKTSVRRGQPSVRSWYSCIYLSTSDSYWNPPQLQQCTASVTSTIVVPQRDYTLPGFVHPQEHLWHAAPRTPNICRAQWFPCPRACFWQGIDGLLMEDDFSSFQGKLNSYFSSEHFTCMWKRSRGTNRLMDSFFLHSGHTNLVSVTGGVGRGKAARHNGQECDSKTKHKHL